MIGKKSSEIRDRLGKLRKRMNEEGISLYMVTTSDFHLSEIPCDYFKTLEYISGFTGSEAKMIITEKNAHIWTDGRYSIQAKEELEGTGINIHIYSDLDDEIRTLPLFFAASGGVIFESMYEYATEGSETDSGKPKKYVIGCDGRTFSYSLVDEILEELGPAFDTGTVVMNAKLDLIGDIWEDRPPLPLNRVKILPEEVAGESVESKLNKIRTSLADFGGESAAVISMLDDIAWLFNIRGDDIADNMTVLSYAYITIDDAYIFVDERKLTGRIREYFTNNGVTVKAYNEFYSFLGNAEEKFILVDDMKTNAAIILTVANKKDTVLIDGDGLIEKRKAIKNITEQKNAREIHIKDGIAVTKFIKWVKENVGKVKMTELSASSYLEFLRKKQGAIKPSFETICAYGANAAVVHYTATEEHNAEIEPEGFLLIDSGAHYMGGTTDITRTIPLGRLTDDMKKSYTVVLAAMLELGNFVFKEKTCDSQLDIIARAQMWKFGMDFDHGTGHGVGSMLNVHEGPQNISFRKRKASEIRPGMITTDEPGFYVEGKYGIRHENEMICRKAEEGFLKFDFLTWVPIDISAVDKRYLTESQIKMLNRYNNEVYNRISPYLNEDEKKWLCKETAAIAI